MNKKIKALSAVILSFVLIMTLTVFAFADTEHLYDYNNDYYTYDEEDSPAYGDADEAYIYESKDNVYPEGKSSTDLIKRVLICLAVGIVVGFIVVSSMKSKLKSVKPQRAASNYEVPGSMNLTVKYDNFLYKNVTATPKPKNNPPVKK